MSIKGSPYQWFRSALARGDLLGVKSAALELANGLQLADALAVVLLMAEEDDARYDRAAARWLARLVLERPSVLLDELRHAAVLLEALPYNPDAAKAELRALCGRNAVEGVVGLLG